MAHVAVLLSGQVRGFKHTAKNLLTCFGKADLYFYLQQPSDYSVEDYVKAKSVVYEADVLHDTNLAGDYAHDNRQAFLQQWYSMYKCKELMVASGKKYDWVVRTRPDNDLITPIDLRVADHESINVCAWGGHGGINDRFAIGSYKNMLVYSDFYFNIHKFSGNSETKLQSYLNDCAIAINFIDYMFYRLNDDGSRREHP